MGFAEIEKAGKRVFERFPVIKKSAKRVYQLASVALSNEKWKSEGELTKVSPDDEYEYFYGYYDKSPWDADDRTMIALKVRQSFKSPAPKEPGEVVLLDAEGGNKVRTIGVTHSWNVQQGCMAQWLGPDFKSRIIYNDFRDGRCCSVIYSLEEEREVKVLPLPVYDVSKDGTFALSLDFYRLHRMRPGYGYSNLPDASKGVLCPDETCIWKMNLETGEAEGLFKYTDFASFEHDASMDGAEHKVNHLMISPNGKRFMVLHRWFQKGHKHTRLVTANTDGTQMYNLSDDVFVSHCFWKNNEEILSFLRKKETGDHYYLMKDQTREYRMLWPELNTDGHCSYSPDGTAVITDTYPNRKRIATVYLCSEADDKSGRLARVFSPFRYDNDCRCDLHPRWNRAGDKICIDSVHEGKRGMYVIPIRSGEAESAKEGAGHPVKPRVLMVNTVPMIYDGITMTILNYVTNMDRSDIQIDFVAVNHVEDRLKDQITALGSGIYELTDRNKSQLKYVKELASVVRDGKYNVVHIHCNSCTAAIDLLGAKLGGAKLRCPHSHNTKCAHNAINTCLRPVFNALYTDGFACGEEAGKWLYGTRQFTVLKNATDTEKYAFNSEYRKAFREKYNLDGKIAVGHVAHFTQHKNHPFLIDFFREVAAKDGRYILFLIGDGRFRSDIEARVKEYGLEANVVFVGTTLEIPQYLSMMDMMVLPSLYEGLPNVMIEWQISGLPIIASDTITADSKLTDSVSFIPLEGEKWVSAVLECDVDLDREAISRQNIQRIRDAGFDIKKQAAFLKEYYGKRLNEGR